MDCIEQTAYPWFTNEMLIGEDLRKLFDPTEEELKFIKRRSRKPWQSYPLNVKREVKWAIYGVRMGYVSIHIIVEAQ